MRRPYENRSKMMTCICQSVLMEQSFNQTQNKQLKHKTNNTYNVSSVEARQNMRLRKHLGAVLAAWILACGDWILPFASATIASPHLFEMLNEDGSSTGFVRVVGGPKEHYIETEDGYTICSHKNGNNGKESWYYCELAEDGGLKPNMNMKVGQSDPSDLPKGIEKSREKALEDCGDFCNQGASQSGVGDALLYPSNDKPNDRRLGAPKNKEPERRRLQGTLKNLVVIFKFSDHASRTLPSVSDIDTLMNSQTNVPGITPTGSVRDVFWDNSDGTFILDSTVAAWVTLDSQYTEAYCANGQSGLTSLFHNCLRNALDKVDAFTDFDEFDINNDGWIDAITFLHSGYGAEWGKCNILLIHILLHYANRIPSSTRWPQQRRSYLVSQMGTLRRWRLDIR